MLGRSWCCWRTKYTKRIFGQTTTFNSFKKITCELGLTRVTMVWSSCPFTPSRKASSESARRGGYAELVNYASVADQRINTCLSRCVAT